MNRETIIAIVLGVSFGLIVGVVVLFQTNKGEDTKVIPISKDNTEKVVSEAPKNNSMTQTNLKITSPADNSLVSEREIEIKGKANANTLIVVQSAASQVVSKIEKADFAIKFPLATGENVIQVSAYSDSSTPQENTMRIYYIPQQ